MRVVHCWYKEKLVVEKYRQVVVPMVVMAASYTPVRVKVDMGLGSMVTKSGRSASGDEQTCPSLQGKLKGGQGLERGGEEQE